MDKAKMFEFAKRIKAAEAAQREAVEELRSFVAEGLLTREEAAKCLAGRRMKIAEEFGIGNPEAVGDLGHNRLLIDQAVDGAGFPGLKAGWHV